MISQSTSPSVLHNLHLQQFEVQAGGQRAFLSYIQNGEQIIFDHTYVPEELRGRGLAAALVRAALDEARKQDWKIVPRCTFVAGFIKQTPEFADLIERPEQP